MTRRGGREESNLGTELGVLESGLIGSWSRDGRAPVNSSSAPVTDLNQQAILHARLVRPTSFQHGEPK